MADSTATILTKPSIQMVVDGPCLRGTLENLSAASGARPLPSAALVKVRTDALRMLEGVLQTYATNVATGEVGVTGSQRAGAEAPVSGRCPTGLLYGRVQSGKTVAMITFCAAAIDNGFRVIVVLTSDFLKLVEQTADRFGALDGPLVRDSLRMDGWAADWEHVAKHIPEHGVVFICTKNQQRLTALVDHLRLIGAADYPALVLDDEADQATLDTTTQARTSGRRNAPKQPSAIHRKTVQDEEGQSIRQTLRHHVFVQVTATPYALLLQNVNTDLRPSFTTLLEAGSRYTGGEAFFDVQHVESGDPPLVFVDEMESARIDDDPGGDPPLGLQQAIAFFLVAAGAQNVKDPGSRRIGQNFLCHTSQKTTDHDTVAKLIIRYLNRVGDALRDQINESDITLRLHWAHDQLRKTLSDAPNLAEIIDQIKARLPRREVLVVNSAGSQADFGRALNFIVGGNILGRGLTIDNLLVTYYLRRAKISQMDTVLQHARMYGYRETLMPYTRVFLPEDLAARFHFIHVAEQNLRRQLGDDTRRKHVTVETMQALRATRLNVLDTSSLAAYEPGHHIYPGQSALDPKSLESAHEVERAVKQVLGGSLVDRVFVEVPLDTMISLLRRIPFKPENANLWEPDRLVSLLGHLRHRYGGKAFVFYRTTNRKSQTLATGVLSGDELADARRQSAPVLCVFQDDGRALKGTANGQTYWYPTLVLPETMPTQVFNTTA